MCTPNNQILLSNIIFCYTKPELLGRQSTQAWGKKAQNEPGLSKCIQARLFQRWREMMTKALLNVLPRPPHFKKLNTKIVETRRICKRPKATIMFKMDKLYRVM